MDRDERFGQADRVITIGFWVNALLMVSKLTAGYFGHSEAVFADGMESACDFIAILSTMVAVRIGRQPFDNKHPYGHGKAESIAAIIVSLVILVTGSGILYNAVRCLLRREFAEPQLIAVLVAIATVITKEMLFRYSRRVAKCLESPAVAALAKDHRKDALTSVATVVGVSGAYLGVVWMDPLAAGLTAIFIFHIAYETFRDAAHDLMDAQPPEEWIGEVTTIAEGVFGVEHVHEIRCRRSGQFMIVDLKLDMDPQMTVKQSHDIAVEVKKLIFARYPAVGDVMIHINPHDEDHVDLIRL